MTSLLQAEPIPVVPAKEPQQDVKASPQPVKYLRSKVADLETPKEPHLLRDLTLVDRLLITKRLNIRTAFFIRGKRTRFFVRTPDQSLLYNIEEKNTWWAGYFCYGQRPVVLTVTNSQGQEVMRIQRPYRFTTRIFPCQLQRLKVQCPPGHLLGTVEQQWSAVRPKYTVKNDRNEKVFWVKGPLVTLGVFRDVQFDFLRADGSSVGATFKHWQGLMHAVCLGHTHDRFGVAFDHELSVEDKALLMAATILMDYMYYDI